MGTLAEILPREKLMLLSLWTLIGLRQACAAMLMEEGFNPKIVPERLGHAIIATTTDIYSHFLPGL